MINDFQKHPLCVDGAYEFQYLESMDSELAHLEEQLGQLVQRLKVLREENRELRQQLAARTDENARLGEKLNAAKTRIEALLKQIPETES
jgi:cell division protein ZapB